MSSITIVNHSEIKDQRSKSKHQRSKIKAQRSEIKDQRSSAFSVNNFFIFFFNVIYKTTTNKRTNDDKIFYPKDKQSLERSITMTELTNLTCTNVKLFGLVKKATAFKEISVTL